MEETKEAIKSNHIFVNLPIGLTFFWHKSKGLELLLNSVKVPDRLMEFLCEELKIPIFELKEQVDLDEMKRRIESESDSKIVMVRAWDYEIIKLYTN